MPVERARRPGSSSATPAASDDREATIVATGIRRDFATTPGVQLFGGDEGNPGSAATRDNYWLSSILIDPSKAGWEASDLRLISRPLISSRGHCGSRCTCNRSMHTGRRT